MNKIEDEIEWIDGFLLGDGFINYHKKDNEFKSARFVIASTQKQWAEFGISGLKQYQLSEPKQYGKVSKNRPNLMWTCRTLTHDNITEQAKRWYPNFKKKIPTDIRITPTSLLLWYLGDGSIHIDKVKNSTHLRFATCSFESSDINDILIKKLNMLGLLCSLEKSKNDISIRSESISKFFDLIGHESPIQCYNYKFKYPEWLNLKRLSSICKNKNEIYKSQYLYKKGLINCTKSPGGKMLLFNKEQENDLLIKLKNDF